MLIYYKYAYTGESAGWLGEFHEAGSFRKKKKLRVRGMISNEGTRRVRLATSGDIFG